MNRILVGAQWGDEGKGKVGYLLADDHRVAARFSGGPNAGHTLSRGDERIVFRQLPSASLNPNINLIVVGRGVVVDIPVLADEVKLVREARPGVNIWVDPTASVITLGDRSTDKAHESLRQIGSTQTGVGPAQAGRRTRMGSVVEDHLEFMSEIDVEVTSDAGDPRLFGRELLACGAHGIMLDPYLGHYPFVTSSPCGPEAVTQGLGLSMRDVDQVVGVVKAYTTLVGDGPIHGPDMAGLLRDERASVTGRVRRVRPLNLPALAWANSTARFDSLVLTRVDSLGDGEPIPVVTGYDEASMINGKTAVEFETMTPHLAWLQGWMREQVVGVRSFADLPIGVRQYVSLIEEYLGVPIQMLSTGPDIEDVVRR